MDAESGRILYGKEEQTPRPMASTTKIMTCLLALEQSSPSEEVSFSSRAVSMPKVHLGASKGSSFAMNDLLHSLMLESHNDTAVAIAEHIGGSVEGFADKMNQKAAQLGLNATHFVTPNGLDADGHQSTPADMCRLASYACQNKNFLKIIQTPSKTISDKKGHSYSLTNHDAFLTSYSGALGIKTGFTGKAGYCFVGAAKRENLTLSSCVLASGWPPDKSRKWADTKALMDYGFTHFKKQKISFQDFSKTPLRVADGIKNQVFLRVPEPITLPLASFETLEIHYRLPASVTAPVSTSDPVGTIECRINAEDPFNNFTPCPGRIELFIPAGGPNVRMDTHAYSGYRIPTYYDSMIGKLIVWGPTRADALATCRRALDEITVEGIKTTIPFQKLITNHKSFIEGKYDTGFVERLMQERATPHKEEGK